MNAKNSLFCLEKLNVRHFCRDCCENQDQIFDLIQSSCEDKPHVVSAWIKANLWGFRNLSTISNFIIYQIKPEIRTEEKLSENTECNHSWIMTGYARCSRALLWSLIANGSKGDEKFPNCWKLISRISQSLPVQLRTENIVKAQKPVSWVSDRGVQRCLGLGSLTVLSSNNTDPI